MNCQRCGDEIAWHHESITLNGGVVAGLCNACRTAWDAFVRGSEPATAANAAQARNNHYVCLAYAHQPVGKADWLALGQERERIDKAFFALGIEFVKPLPEYAERCHAAADAARQDGANRLARLELRAEREKAAARKLAEIIESGGEPGADG